METEIETTKLYTIKFKKLHKDCIIPKKGTEGAAAFDLFTTEDGSIRKGHASIFRTGLALSIPPGFFALIWPRSGLAFKETCVVLGGLLDEDFCGEVKIGLTKMNDDSITPIKKGDRIAQLLILKNNVFQFEEVQELPQTKRGEKGFGSTGKTLEELITDMNS